MKQNLTVISPPPCSMVMSTFRLLTSILTSLISSASCKSIIVMVSSARLDAVSLSSLRGSSAAVIQLFDSNNIKTETHNMITEYERLLMKIVGNALQTAALSMLLSLLW